MRRMWCTLQGPVVVVFDDGCYGHPRRLSGSPATTERWLVYTKSNSQSESRKEGTVVFIFSEGCEKSKAVAASGGLNEYLYWFRCARTSPPLSALDMTPNEGFRQY